jgi:uncharacterized cupredoxin-like copper-binding protein
MSSVSVVTNALRLRSFQRPKDAAEILHPTVWSRVTEYAYLVGIALVALAIGIAALVFSAGTGGMAMTSAAAPPNVSLATRTIALSVSDQLRFTPDAFDVKVGESIAFAVTNRGTLDHEFVIGDAAVQQAHEQEMVNGGAKSMTGGDAAFAIDVPAGQTVTLVYTFTSPGSLIIGCHVPGHFAAGMLGHITVT